MGAEHRRLQSPGGVTSCTSEAEGFSVKENDYCWGDRKIAGNAQAIVKDRWLHHTSFLWDYRREHMALLQEPERQPQYRGERKHDKFLTPLKSFGFRRRDFLESVEEALASHGFEMTLTSMICSYACITIFHSASAARISNACESRSSEVLNVYTSPTEGSKDHCTACDAGNCAGFQDVQGYLQNEHIKATKVISYADLM